MQYKIVVDKQPMTNPSSEKKEYIIDIEELRAKGNIHDSLMFEIDKTYVIRRLKLSEYYVLSILEEPITEALESVNIELFEGDNYIYLIDMTGNKFYAEYLIKNEFNDVFATRKEMNTAIDLTMNQISIAVNEKFTDYSTTEEMNSAIDLKADEINAEVEKKVDEETITGAYLILKINGDTSEAKLNADKIELSANDVLNLLAGNTINLTGKNIAISSTNFNVDKNGNMTCNNANVTGGTIKIGNNFNVNADGTIELKDSGGADSPSLKIVSNGASSFDSSICSFGAFFNGPNGHVEIGADSAYAGGAIFVGPNQGNSSNYTLIQNGRIFTKSLTQYSLKSKKKSIKKLNINALDLIKNADVCEYNFKGEKKGTKKHIGLVIGEGYNCPEQIISEDGQGIEQYSYTSLVTKAFQQYIKQQDKLISDLTTRLEKLEKEVHND